MRLHRVKLGLVAMLVGMSVSAWAAGLDRKQEQALARVNRGIAAQEARLTRMTSGFTDRVIGEFERKATEFEAALNELPADSDSVKQERAHLEAFKAALKAKAAPALAAKASAVAAQDEVKALLGSATFADDVQKLQDMRAMFDDAQLYAFDHYHFARWLDHDDQVKLRKWGETWKATEAAFQELNARYEAAAAYKGRLDGQAAFNQVKLMDIVGPEATEAFEAYRSAVTAFVSGAPGRVQALRQELQTAMDKAVQARDFKAFTNWDGSVMNRVYQIKNVYNAYVPLAPSEADRQKMAQSVQAAEAQLATATAKLASTIVAENRAPADAYRGGERAAIEAKVRKVWSEKFPAEKILAVRITAETYTRRTAWAYRPESRAWYKSDESTLPVRVVVKGGADEAIVWPVRVTKDHMKGDGLFLDWIPRGQHDPTPMQRLLLKNL